MPNPSIHYESMDLTKLPKNKIPSTPPSSTESGYPELLRKQKDELKAIENDDVLPSSVTSGRTEKVLPHLSDKKGASNSNNATKMRYLALYRRYRKKKRVYIKAAWFYRTVELLLFTLPLLMIQLVAALVPIVFDDSGLQSVLSKNQEDLSAVLNTTNWSKKLSTGLAAWTAIMIAADNWVCLINFQSFILFLGSIFDSINLVFLFLHN